ncbi:proliferating cell nuclear antigen-like [Panicum virgatum]|uniref:DNA sliding clamp PCNA n=1 Tax=Panicum virgatum TaxID=38727 RepID=A0A8T0PG51_PANVG|nr:proliferating cell nuclear antigen-like [Panicum virgatum]KAG2561091.1 hypothetical protein PVAP13_8KG108100 [Panicum virgatum]
MLELRLVQATLFKNVVEALGDLFSTAHFNSSRTGLELQAKDNSRVTLIMLLLRAEAFDHYLCDRGLSMGLNLAGMAKAFCCTNNDDIITIKAEEDWSDTVTFTFESPEDGDEISYFHFDFMVINGVPLEIPEYPESEYQAIVRMPSAKFMPICNKLSSFGDRDTVVIISVDKESVDFLSRGKTGTLTIFCRETQTVDKPKEPTLIEMKEKVSLMFDLRYMNSSKASTLSDQVTISLSSKLPAVFEYKITEMSCIRYYMLPRNEGR